MIIVRYPKHKKVDNPNKDVVMVYESGGRDIEHPFSGEALDDLADESEGSWEVDMRNLDSRDEGGYPTDSDEKQAEKDYIKDVQEYPFYYSKKGAPRGKGYPREQDWWQKALSSAIDVDMLSLLKPTADEIADCVFQFESGDLRKSQLWNLIIQDGELTQQIAARLKGKRKGF